jgi:3D (Asp-Asp-Asp) domain-containing protein
MGTRPKGIVTSFLIFLFILLAASISLIFISIIELQRVKEETREHMRYIREQLEESKKFREETKRFLDKLKIEPDMTVSYYAPLDNKSGICADNNPIATATGSLPGPGSFAVNPMVIPYHSDVWILYSDGRIERGKAVDTGGLIRASRSKIDVYRDSYREAMREGVKKAVVIHCRL